MNGVSYAVIFTAGYISLFDYSIYLIFIISTSHPSHSTFSISPRLGLLFSFLNSFHNVWSLKESMKKKECLIMIRLSFFKWNVYKWFTRVAFCSVDEAGASSMILILFLLYSYNFESFSSQIAVFHIIFLLFRLDCVIYRNFVCGFS